MAFPPAFLDELIARNPIEDVVGQYVSLTRKGSNLFGLCPFHGEKTASFSVNPGKQIYYCFGCHKGGGVINFQMEIEGLSYPDAVRALAKRAGMEVPEDGTYQSQYRRQERLWQLCREAARFFREQLFLPSGKIAQEAILKRRFTRQTIMRFGFGYAPDSWSALMDAMVQKGYRPQELLDAGLAVKSEKTGRLYDRFRNRWMVPIIDLRGNVIGFGGRVLDQSEPKYLNSPETIIFNKRKNLFALNVAKKSKQGMLILTEGYMDAIALHQYGFDCAVASLGTSLTPEQATLMSKYTEQVVLTYDSDEAGQNATKRAIPMLEKAGLQVRVLRMKDAKDPDEFLRKFGADAFHVLLEQAEDQADYRLLSLAKKFDLTQDEQKVEFSKQAAALISTFSNAVQREVYGARAAEAAGITPEAMAIEVKKAFQRRQKREKREEEKILLSPATQHQPKERSIRYTNLRSAMAEETILRQLLRSPELFDKVRALTAEQFSSPLLGKVFSALRDRYDNHLTVSLAVLGETLTAEEMAHMTAVMQKEDASDSPQALQDCMEIIAEEKQRASVSSADDLMALRNRLKDKKGYGGSV